MRKRTQANTNRSALHVFRSSDHDEINPPDWHHGVEFTGSTGTYKEITDEVHPGYAQRRIRGDVILGNLSLGTWERTFSGMSLSVSGANNYLAHWSGDCAALLESRGLVGSPPSYPNLQSAALIDAYAKIRANAVNTAEVVCDLTKTIRMIQSPMRSSVKFLVKMMKKRNKRLRDGASSVTQASANAWLEYSYGMRPLILDISTALKNAASFRARSGRKRLVARSGKKWSGNSHHSFSDVMLPSKPWMVTGSSSLARKVRVGAGVIYEVRSQTSSAQLIQDYRLDASSVAPSIWELMPYSFVVDWFVNVGNFFEAHNLPPNVEILGNWVTTIDELQQDLHSGELVEGPFTGSYGSSTIKTCGVTRSVNVPLPTSPVVLRTPLSAAQAISGAALLVNPILGLLGKLRH